MSKAYDKYLEDHINSVKQSVRWIFKHCDNKKLNEIIPKAFHWEKGVAKYPLFVHHDGSKYSEAEYKAYDDYFYGEDGIKRQGGPSEDVERAFQYAWLHHIHNNPHHWQHWILNNDDKEEGEVVLEMPDRCILEMICDWWSFSWRNGDLWSLWHWWSDHGDYIRLGEKTREKVVALLDILNQALMDNEDEGQ